MAMLSVLIVVNTSEHLTLDKMIISISARCRKCWMWIHVNDNEQLKKAKCSCWANDWEIWEVTTEMIEKTHGKDKLLQN